MEFIQQMLVMIVALSQFSPWGYLIQRPAHNTVEAQIDHYADYLTETYGIILPYPMKYLLLYSITFKSLK